RAKKIEWCSFEIIEAIFECVIYLSKSEVRWRYLQIISDVDAPLKTNLEAVRILKAMNGSFNTEILPFERYRLNRKRLKNSPLPPVKSSMAAIFSREAADFMTNSDVIYKQLKFFNGTSCADESLWGTIAGNLDSEENLQI
ncbi:Core-2/I-Branching enzyme, partial [Oesophagostomum dentatum]